MRAQEQEGEKGARTMSTTARRIPRLTGVFVGAKIVMLIAIMHPRHLDPSFNL